MIQYVMVLSAVVALVHGDCSVNIRTQLNFTPPLFLRNNQLWAPNGPALQWNAGETTLIACPGSTIVNTGTVAANIQCVFGTTFNLGGTLVNLAGVSCVKNSTGTHQRTSQSCGQGGTLLNLGFDVPCVGFVTYIQSCYNMQTASIIFTHHVIRGAAIKHRFIKKKDDRPDFKSVGTPSFVSPRTSYSQPNKETRFALLLGSQAQADRFFAISSLSRGHLSPDADGIFLQWQFATYFYVNAAPQWQTTNTGNWAMVENAARNIAERLNENVLIYTGVHEILRLPNVNGQQVEITLENGGIQVPKWFWKIIKSPNLNAAIALVHNNDLFQTTIPELLCQDVCDQYGWNKAKYRILARGYTYCCTVAELRGAIPSIPAVADAVNVLHFNTDI